MKNDKKDKIMILTTRGPITIRRTVLRPGDKEGLKRLMSEEKTKCIVPLDALLGIDALPFKMTRRMMCDVAFWAQNQCSFKATETIFKNDETKYKPWAENVIDNFKTGQKEEALEEIQRFADIKIPKGTVNLLNYVKNNIDRVDYAQYIENGYYVGSGAIESGNKVVLQKRMKLAGMRWNEITAQYLLSLRAKFESNLWNESVVNKILNYSFTVS